MLAAGLLFLVAVAPARTKEHFGDGFSIDLNHPANQVIDLVRAVTQDGIIRGTWEYRGTNELDGAVPAKTSDALPEWTGGGTVLYKIRPGTLAPEHFYQSNDQGTVVVRYVIQPLTADSCRLRIDAIFQEDTHHHHHPSDGQVEAAEFEAIAAKIKDLEVMAQKRQEMEARQQLEQKVQDLQAQLEQEKGRLDQLNNKEGNLRQQIEASQGGKAGSISAAGAVLKAAPYEGSKALQELSEGEAVRVLQQTPYWFRVQTADGHQGWVYRLMLEVAQ